MAEARSARCSSRWSRTAVRQAGIPDRRRLSRGRCAAEITTLLQQAREAPLPGANFWSWQHATRRNVAGDRRLRLAVPRVLVAVQEDGDTHWHDLYSRFQGDHFLVQPAAFAALVGLQSDDRSWARCARRHLTWA